MESKTPRLIRNMVLALVLVLIACQDQPDGDSTAAPVTAPTSAPQSSDEAVITPARPTETPIPFPQSVDEISFVTVVMDAPSRDRDFAVIDEYGRVLGFDPAVMARIWAETGTDIEYVVTSYDGMLESVANGEFDMAMSALLIPDQNPAGITFTDPYLEVGQVLVVRADEKGITQVTDLPPAAVLGVEFSSGGEQAARDLLAFPEDRLRRYDSVPRTLQALIDRDVDGVIIDSDDAQQYVANYYQQLQIAGGGGPESWITSRSYGIAVAAENTVLLNLLNNSIAQLRASNAIDEVTGEWLVAQERLIAGESLIGTLDQEFVLGMVSTNINLDPATALDPISWELQLNTISGLMGFTPDNELVPVLAADFPAVSPDGLVYTFRLRDGLTFPDGSLLTADDVLWSLSRPIRQGNFLVNSFLKDANIDGFADDDALEVVDERTIRIVLDEPSSYFLAVLASPPYGIISDGCYTLEPQPDSTCGGIGPYTIVDWERGEQMRLKANPSWPGTPPAFENIQVRFYSEAVRMRRSLEIGAIDVAWLGLPLDDLLELRNDPAYSLWEGPAAFKSYLVFEHKTPPWNIRAVREAAAYSLDREALSAIFQGTRLPLYSPIPDQVPGHTAAQPARNLDRARTLLEFAGYTEDEPLAVTIDYVSDGRYSAFEEAYAEAIKEQLEETGVFQVTLEGAAYDVFRQESATCQSGAFVLGWPPSGQPPYYLDPAHWMNYFVFNTDTICSNYESEEMTAAMAAMERVDPNDAAARAAAYADIQTLWAEEFPTLDLTQELRLALSLAKVQEVKIDALGLLRYETLRK